MEGADVIGGGEGADRAVAFGPGGSVVGAEEARFGTFVCWDGVVDRRVDGEG